MNENANRSWWGRNWKWVVPVGCLAPVVVCGGFVAVLFTFVFGLIKNAAPYTESLAAVQANPQVVEALGEPIEPAFLVAGEVNYSSDDGNADLSYNVSGPKGEATVRVVGQKTAGQWRYSVMAVQLAETGERIDLRPSAEAEAAP